MTQTWDCAEARTSLGVYVLGAIDPAERGLVDAHLATCRDCRDELAGLADARRRRNRWRYLSAAAAVAAIAGGLFAGLSSATSTTITKTDVVSAGQGKWETVTAANAATGVTSTVAYSKELWGDAFQVVVKNIPVGTTCQLWVVHPDGTETEVAAWTTSRDEGKVWYAGSMASTAGAIGKFQITAGNRVLLTVTPT
jgi:putative zinc finger protein